MKRLLLLVPLLMAVGCPGGPKPPPPAACNPFSEDQDAEDHCSKSKEACEKTLSKILADAHRNRCPVGPCTGFSAWVECKPLNQDCPIGETEIGMLFSTKEHLRCVK